MANGFTNEEIEKLIDYLRGTCINLDLGIEGILGEDLDFTNLSPENCSHLDEQIFNCEACGWWVESHTIEEDSQGNNVCEDCI